MRATAKHETDVLIAGARPPGPDHGFRHMAP